MSLTKAKAKQKKAAAPDVISDALNAEIARADRAERALAEIVAGARASDERMAWRQFLDALQGKTPLDPHHVDVATEEDLTFILDAERAIEEAIVATQYALAEDGPEFDDVEAIANHLREALRLARLTRANMPDVLARVRRDAKIEARS